jgi:leucyl aminopeptidase
VNVEATTAGSLATGADTIIVGLFEDEPLARDPSSGALTSLVSSGEARGGLGRLATAHSDQRRFVVVGLGRRRDFGAEPARRAAAAAHRRARELATRVLCWELPEPGEERIAEALVEGTLIHAYRFERYRPPGNRPRVERLIIAAPTDVSGPVRESAIVAGAQNRARDLGNTPANDLTPGDLAAYAQRLQGDGGRLAVTVLDGEQIRAAGMGAFAAVAQGSAEGARLIQIEYEGSGQGRSRPRLAMVGKGVTFDSGGISLKSPATMHEMKFDMCGAAAVIEAMSALAELGWPGRALAVVGATENLPSGTAVKPGDIVRALDGTTIEVNNTDAEGRLLLADCLCHARAQGCDRIIDVATLTGGVVAALGSFYAGLMANDDGWARAVEAAGARAGEPVWRLPLHLDYAQMVKGRYAQLTNRTERREAMAITAAELLHHFAGEVPWAHLDIAGTAWDVPLPYFVGKGATGYGVRLLVELACSREGPQDGEAATESV